MGTNVGARQFTREERQNYRRKVQVCLDVLEQMLKRDGLTESDLQRAAEQARQAVIARGFDDALLISGG